MDRQIDEDVILVDTGNLQGDKWGLGETTWGGGFIPTPPTPSRGENKKVVTQEAIKELTSCRMPAPSICLGWISSFVNHLVQIGD